MTLVIRLAVTVLAFLIGMTAVHVQAEEGDWPIEIQAPNAKIVIYQPQLETFEDNHLTGRAAVAVTKAGEAEPVFGAVWMDARVDTDRDTRMVSILDAKVTRVKFAEASEENQKKLADIIEGEVPRWNMSLSLDSLLASLELVEKEHAAAKDLKFTPPKIIFVETPTVLVTIDGEPELTKVEDSKLMRVANTPFLIALDTGSKKYYLDGGEVWYIADEAKGPWMETGTVPKEVVALRPPESKEDQDAGESTPDEGPADQEDAEKDDRVPAIIVATEPTELIVSDGEPKYKTVEGGELLYMSSSDSDVFLEIQTQRYFVLLSGRWYAGDALKGPWTHVPSDKLPQSFAKIPSESEVGHTLTFVAGTDEAKEAVLDSQVPQTTAINRKTTKFTVTYDGDPKLKSVENSDILYAVNTNVAVFKVGKKYYACNQAVWFVADSPQGPWVVAIEVPQEVYTIPPSCPHYNVKYVYIYDYTDEVVYVGYTGGYTLSYIYGGTIVYGTGWYYPGWYRTVYYAYPATWGYHVRYNPWYGWGFGLSYSTGRFTFHFGWGGWYRGWWGPRGWHGYGRGYRHGYRHGYRQGARAGYRAGQRQDNRSNIYNRAENRARNADRSQIQNRNRPNTAIAKPNNVFTDRDGNVHRRTEDGWQKREGGGWSKPEQAENRAGTQDRTGSRDITGDRPAGSPDRKASTTLPGDWSTGREGTQPSTTQSRQGSQSSVSRQAGQQSGRSGLERDYQARQQGTQRTNTYRQSSGSRSRGGGSRGGGGGRRR